MLHQPISKFVPAPTYPVLSTASPEDVNRAKAWIAGARTCGMVVAPWKDSVGPDARGCVMQTGQDEHGRNNWSSASDRFMRHPASVLKRELPQGLVFEVLCHELDLDPADAGAAEGLSLVWHGLHARQLPATPDRSSAAAPRHPLRGDRVPVLARRAPAHRGR